MRNLVPAYALALAIFVVDQVSKWIMIGPLALEQVRQIVLLPIFNFTWVQNFGISLGLAQAENDTQRWLLVALTGAIALGVGYWITREEKGGDRLALALVLGGALGNIVDRSASAMSSTSSTCTLASSGPFMSLMSPTRRLASAS